MDYSEMTVEEIVEWLLELMSKNEDISLDLLKDIVASRSVVDPVADANAVAIFYSGEPDKLIDGIAATDNPTIRLIRRTEAFQLLSYSNDITGISFERFVAYAIKRENPTLTDTELEKAMTNAMYGVSEAGTEASVVGDGLWTQISARFAADTKGDAFSLCSNARDDRIFARDELKN